MPFSPRHAFLLRVLPVGFSLLYPSGTLALMVLSPPQIKDLAIVAGVWFFVLWQSFAFLMAVHEKLCFDHEGIERVSGLRRHRIPYANIKTIELKMRFSRGDDVPVILIGTSLSRVSNSHVSTEIFLSNCAPGEGRKMLHILAEQVPGGVWAQKARDLPDSRSYSRLPC